MMWAPTPPRRSWYQLLASTSLLRYVGRHSWDIAASCISLFSLLITLAAVWPVSKANAQSAETTSNCFHYKITSRPFFCCNALRRMHIAVCCCSSCAQLTAVMAITVAVPFAGCGREQGHSHVCPCSSQESGCCSLTSLNIFNVP